MIVISDSSPLVALSRVDHLSVLKKLFGKIYIPDAVFEETVVHCNITIQKANLQLALNDFIEIVTPRIEHSFSRNLGKGEKGVLNLAMELKPDILLMDDRKAGNEAKALGFVTTFTSDMLKAAAKRNFVSSYEDVVRQLQQLGIYLPE